MPSLFRRNDDRKKALNSLVLLRTKLQTEKMYPPSDGSDAKAAAIESKVDDILIKLRQLDQKIENIKRERINEVIEEEKIAKISGNEEPEGVRTMKVKSMIRSLLDEHGKLTAADIGNMLKLSRTRSSEYLKEMERKSALKSSTIRRKKFYELKK